QLDEDKEVLSLHLVNGNIDEKKDVFRTVRESTWRVRLPDGFQADQAKIVRLEAPEESEVVPIRISKGQVSIKVPRIDCYTIVSFYAGDALKKAEERSKGRRADLMSTVKTS